MKTAEECLDMLASAYRCPDVAMSETINLIRLEAMKEGMRRAAEIAHDYNQHHIMAREAILTAAEQLTEKDLNENQSKPSQPAESSRSQK